MAYYDTIRTPRDFVEAASSQEALSFADLHQSNYWETGASHWGVLQPNVDCVTFPSATVVIRCRKQTLQETLSESFER